MGASPGLTPLPRSFYDRPVLEVARDLLGSLVVSRGVVVRVTEVEAYDGGNDPASHAFRGSTARNAVMFGPPGHLYVYFTYGMHHCANLVCGPEGKAAAVLLRAGEVVDGIDVVRARRPAGRDRDLARGPARLAKALGLDLADVGHDVTRASAGIWVAARDRVPDDAVRTGPRVGIRTGADLPWRFWIADEATVSQFRPAVTRARRGPVG
ncbi:MAG: 3-methyladenine glycosylase [Frankiales bacterium]|nr:3-methyladenine glycosylase [Frankiales bacterium]